MLKLSLVKEGDLAAVLAKQLNIPYASPESQLLKPKPEQELEKLIPKDFAIKNLVLPLSKNLNSLTCAIFDPLDITLLDNLQETCQLRAQPGHCH